MALNAQGEKSETSKHRKQEGCSSQPFMPEETKNRWERDSSKRNGDIAIQKKTRGGQMKKSEKANRKQQR